MDNRLQQARERFGQPFAHEPGATWQPRKVPVLTEWMQKRGKEQKDETKDQYGRVV